ncbi:MAG: hypothetical protein AAF678_11815 [Pseudomonadota bacterium]
MKVHALWCHPRSVSTAFERIMRERGDLDVLHEPFMYHHYLTRADGLFADFQPEPGHPTRYEDIRQMILTRSQVQPVFFKDMAYYVDADLPRDPDFAGAMTHAFLVRDPAESILSYHRRQPDFTCQELGLVAQLALYDALVEQEHRPLVLTADQLRSHPEVTLGRYWAHVGLPFETQAFHWQTEVPEDWRAVSAWHERAVSSGRIEAPADASDPQAALALLGAPYTDYDRHHRAAYDKLKQIAEDQAAASGPTPSR